jgi:hypothetical protein
MGEGFEAVEAEDKPDAGGVAVSHGRGNSPQKTRSLTNGND